MGTNEITLAQITEQLVKIYTNPGKLATYNGINEQYTMFCGWTGGVNAPESRPAYVRTFGADVVATAEDKARRELVDSNDAYKRSQWAVMAQAADDHTDAGEPVPSPGVYIWGMGSNLKCDGGRGLLDEIEAQEVYCDEVPTPSMLHVSRVITTTAAELDRPELADELAAANRLPGGGWMEEDERLKLIAPYRLVCIEVTVVTDGKRYYYIDSEGYDYARYIFLPLSWREMFATELQAVTAKEQARQAKKQAERDAAHAAAVAEYRAKCDRWAHLMRPVTELEAALDGTHYGTPEYKATARALAAARRANILAMCRAASPGVKFSVRQYNGWGGSWELTYTDGPTEEAFAAAVDLDLFRTYRDTYDGYTDCADTIRTSEEYCTFARTYMGRRGTGGVRVERKKSDTAAATIRARVLEKLPELADGRMIRSSELTNAQRNAYYELTNNLTDNCTWFCLDSVTRDVFDATNFTLPAVGGEATE